MALRAAGRRWRARALPAGGRFARDAAYARAPALLALGAAALLVLRGDDESKPIWPLNAPDVLYGALFFLYGYGLYARRELIARLQDVDVLGALWVAAGALYLARLALLGAIDGLETTGADPEALARLRLAEAILYGTLAALLCVGLVGLFERLLPSLRPGVRWLADSSYWIYIIHLPVVALATFALAHLDRQGRLEQLTGVAWGAEAKFLAACAVTAAVGVLSYRYLVRDTPLGNLLNGRRRPGAPGA